MRADSANASLVYRALAAFGAPLSSFEVGEADFATYDGVLQMGVRSHVEHGAVLRAADALLVLMHEATRALYGRRISHAINTVAPAKRSRTIEALARTVARDTRVRSAAP